MEYYVYVVKVEGEVKYVGMGRGDRYLHVTSGTSHNYELNKAHFDNKHVDVRVLSRKFNKRCDAVEYEKRWIIRMTKSGKELYNKITYDGNGNLNGIDWKKRDVKDKLKKEVKKLSDDGWSARKIAKEFGKSNRTISTWLNEM